MLRLGWRAVAAAILLTLVAAGCGERSRADAASIEVVAAFYPLAEAAKEIGAESVGVSNLTPAGVEPHDLELRPSHVGLLRSADLILYLGQGFQPALEDVIETLPDRSAAIDLLEGLPLRPGLEDEEHEGEEQGEHAEGGADPHVWLDPQLMKRIVDRAAEALSARAPDDRAAIERRASEYEGSLDGLDRDFEETLRTCRRRDVVTAHAAFGYLAARYRLEQIPISGISPEAEPSPRRLQEVARLARERHVTTIFFETLVSPRVAEFLARAVGARSAVLNPIEGLTEEQVRAGETYASLMRSNLAALAHGLGCGR